MRVKATHPMFREALEALGFSPAGDRHMTSPSGMPRKEAKSLASKTFLKLPHDWQPVYCGDRCQCVVRYLSRLPRA